MGTRSLTIIKNEDSEEIVVMYKQYDGYPDGHGKELTDFLSNKLIVNGFSSDDVLAFNGMACLAASVVAHFKDGIGDIYLYPAKTRDCGEEYTYFVTGKIGEEANIEVIDTYEGNSLFNGKASDYENWISDLATE